MAHNNFKVLNALICALDNERNDIFVHIDKKTKIVPSLKSDKSKLYVLSDRIDVQWGHISQVLAEYALFEYSVSKGEYDYFHLISGTHFPLKSQHDIDKYFEGQNNQSIVQPLGWGEGDVTFKLGMRHYFLNNAVIGNSFIHWVKNILWRFSLRLQRKSTHRKDKLFKGKYSQWVSLSAKDMINMLEYKDEVIRNFRYALCSDEHFIPYIFNKAGIKPIETDKLLFMDFPGASPEILKYEDYDKIVSSGCLFARKVVDTEMGLVDRIRQGY